MNQELLTSLSPRMLAGSPPDRLLSSNLAALAACDLDLSRRVAAARPETVPDGISVYAAATGAPTISAGALQIHSAYDPLAEALVQAAQVPQDAGRALLLGLGAGHLAAALLARPGLTRLDVLPMNAAVLRVVATRVDLKPLLCDHRLRFVVEERPALTLPFAVVPPLLTLGEPRVAAIRDQALDALAVRAARFQRDADLPLIEAHRMRNGQLHGADPDAAALAGRHRGCVALVVDGGPSFEGALPTLQRLRAAFARQVVLIATESAVRPLCAAGLIPDYVAAAGTHPDLPVVFGQGQGGDCSLPASATLIYTAAVPPAVPAAWRGARYRCQELSPPAGSLAMTESALLLAVLLARHVGTGALILCGADLGYPGGRAPRFAVGAPETAQPWFRQVPAQGGGVVPASSEQIACRLSLQVFLREALRDWPAYHCAPGGAHIAGPVECPLADALGALRLGGP
jgi:hypothetical protein